MGCIVHRLWYEVCDIEGGTMRPPHWECPTTFNRLSHWSFGEINKSHSATFTLEARTSCRVSTSCGTVVHGVRPTNTGWTNRDFWTNKKRWERSLWQLACHIENPCSSSPSVRPHPVNDCIDRGELPKWFRMPVIETNDTGNTATCPVIL
jgi:hypothetical protein